MVQEITVRLLKGNHIVKIIMVWSDSKAMRSNINKTREVTLFSPLNIPLYSAITLLPILAENQILTYVLVVQNHLRLLH